MKGNPKSKIQNRPSPLVIRDNGPLTTDELRTTLPDFNVEEGAVSFWLKVKPRSARERLAYDSSGELRLELHAPPSENEANQACIYFFAQALRLPQACVSIISGRRSRRKLIRITGRSAEETVAGIKALASPRPTVSF